MYLMSYEVKFTKLSLALKRYTSNFYRTKVDEFAALITENKISHKEAYFELLKELYRAGGGEQFLKGKLLDKESESVVDKAELQFIKHIYFSRPPLDKETLNKVTAFYADKNMAVNEILDAIKEDKRIAAAIKPLSLSDYEFYKNRKDETITIIQELLGINTSTYDLPCPQKKATFSVVFPENPTFKKKISDFVACFNALYKRGTDDQKRVLNALIDNILTLNKKARLLYAQRNILARQSTSDDFNKWKEEVEKELDKGKEDFLEEGKKFNSLIQEVAKAYSDSELKQMLLLVGIVVGFLLCFSGMGASAILASGVLGYTPTIVAAMVLSEIGGLAAGIATGMGVRHRFFELTPRKLAEEAKEVASSFEDLKEPPKSTS